MRYDYSVLNCAFETKAEKDDTATFTGIASTTDIDSQNDVIEAGAFNPIPQKQSGEPDVLMLRDHDRSHVIGGWRQFSQEGHQLIVEGELCLAVEKARETHALMKRGYLSGLSVGFSIPENGTKIDRRNNRRYIKKATLKECSIVAFPSNSNARVLSVKHDTLGMLTSCGMSEDDAEILMNEGIEALLERKRDPKKPWGDVDYADPGYQEDGIYRYPIDTVGRIRAAWNYINKPDNQEPYTREQVDRIKGRIIAAWKRRIDSDGPPAAQEDSAPLPEYTKRHLILGIDEHEMITEAVVTKVASELLSKLKGQVSHG